MQTVAQAGCMQNVSPRHTVMLEGLTYVSVIQLPSPFSLMTPLRMTRTLVTLVWTLSVICEPEKKNNKHRPAQLPKPNSY